MPTEMDKNQWMASALSFHEIYYMDGDFLLDHTVTGDEMWVSCVNCETKLIHRMRPHVFAPKIKAMCADLSVRKIMVTVFGIEKGYSIAINSEAYFESLRSCKPIQNK